MSDDLLKAHISDTMEIAEPLLDSICASFDEMEVRKGEYVLRQGNPCRFEAYVCRGCFRIFVIDEKGNEKILYFAEADWWLMDIDSFMNRSASVLNIQALEDSVILSISQQEKDNLYQRFPTVEKFFRLMFQKAVVAWQRRLIRNHTQTALERYQYFLQKYPGIAVRVTDRHIASYLGISHEFLSKIKKKTAV
ncbi:MAG: Crp/Fnr family transcriptional regulator [Saprospiraceae bacterium]|nr:Crp/Fnr family transcriptional regulator [Saprospiraceae bacterium]